MGGDRAQHPVSPPEKKKWHTNYTKADIKVSRPVQYCPLTLSAIAAQ